jgi:hypothetical protein
MLLGVVLLKLRNCTCLFGQRRNKPPHFLVGVVTADVRHDRGKRFCASMSLLRAASVQYLVP